MHEKAKRAAGWIVKQTTHNVLWDETADCWIFDRVPSTWDYPLEHFDDAKLIEEAEKLGWKDD